MCELTLAAWQPNCPDISGIRNLYVISKAARITAGISYAVLNGAITITGTGGAAFKLEPKQNTFTASNAEGGDVNANSLFYTQTLNGVLHGSSAAKKSLVQEINKGVTEWLVEYADGTFEFYGTDTMGMQSDRSGDGQNSGTAAADAKGSTINLISESAYIAPTLATFSEFEAAFTVTEP